MPQNKNLTPVTLPMELKFDQEPKTKFYNMAPGAVPKVDNPRGPFKK